MAGAPHPKPTPRPKAATKQRRKQAGGQVVRAEVARRSGGLCELGGPNCTRKAEQFHHRLMRSQGGPDSAENLLHVCGADHTYIHAYPERSYARGWLLRSTAGLSPDPLIRGDHR